MRGQEVVSLEGWGGYGMSCEGDLGRSGLPLGAEPH